MKCEYAQCHGEGTPDVLVWECVTCGDRQLIPSNQQPEDAECSRGEDSLPRRNLTSNNRTLPKHQPRQRRSKAGSKENAA